MPNMGASLGAGISPDNPKSPKQGAGGNASSIRRRALLRTGFWAAQRQTKLDAPFLHQDRIGWWAWRKSPLFSWVNRSRETPTWVRWVHASFRFEEFSVPQTAMKCNGAAGRLRDDGIGALHAIPLAISANRFDFTRQS